MTFSIVILSYNTPELLIKCINSLEKQFAEELKDEFLEIIIVDNASKKNVVEVIEKKFLNKKNIKIIKNSENLGFGKGCNLGVENSSGDFVLFLNSDTRVEDKGLLGMVNFLKENEKIAIVGGKLLNPDGTPQKSVGKFYNLLNFFIMIFGGERFGLLKSSPEKICEVDWVAGASLMVSKKLFNEIGGFDKNIFMYMEDMEFCYRARKKGFKTYFYPEVSITHEEQGSSNRSFAVLNIYEGIIYFYKKHKNKISFEIVKITLLTKALMVYLLGRMTNNSYYINTYGEALRRVR